MGGMLIILNIQQSIVQLRMGERLESDTSSFEYFILSNTKYKESMLNSKEISFKGKMYDINSRTFSVDSVTLQVIHDNDEEFILQMIKNFIANMGAPNRKQASQIKIFGLFKYISPQSELLFLIPSIHFNLYNLSGLNFDTFRMEIIPPPPKIA
jgi:hypothetical protein